MWGPIVVTVAPAGEPVALADTKAHLRVDGTDDDALIGTQIAAARAHVEAMTGTRLYTQTVTFKTDRWSDLLDLPTAPVQSITSVGYVDTAGDAQTLAGTVYAARIDGLEPSLVLKFGQSFPPIQDRSQITVTAVVGYGDGTGQPPAIVHAIKLIVGDMYAQRETVSDGSAVSVPVVAGVDALLCNHRKHLI